MRFTTKGNILYAIVMGVPKENILTIKSLSKNLSKTKRVKKVVMLGYSGALKFAQNDNSLEIIMPNEASPSDVAVVFRIT